MSALVRDRNTPAGKLDVFEFPAGGATIYRGAMVGIDNAGKAWPAGNAAVVLVVGRAETGTFDFPVQPALTPGQNPSGVVTAVGGVGSTIRVRRNSEFAWDNSTGTDAITAANWGATVYAVDDHTVALTNGGGARLPAGVCRGLTAGGTVWVQTI